MAAVVTITWADVVDMVPSLASVPSATQSAILADVALQIANDDWGARADLAAKWLAAHLATLHLRGVASAAGAAAGPVTSESVGSVSRGYGSPSGSFSTGDASLMQTPWGLEYIRIRSQIIGFRAMVL